MLKWLKRKLPRQGGQVSKRQPPTTKSPWESPFVGDVETLLQPIDLDWEEDPEPDELVHSDPWRRWFQERERRFSLMVDRNLLGKELEKANDISTAIALYEANVRDGFDGNGPYDRLAIIYRREGRLDDEIRVLRRGIEVFSAYRGPRTDVQPKLIGFQNRLERAETLKRRQGAASSDKN
jgi:hypothetical protein